MQGIPVAVPGAVLTERALAILSETVQVRRGERGALAGLAQ